MRTTGVVLFSLCGLFGWLTITRSTVRPPGPDRVWRDFQELFGIVWMKRALDRINMEFAEREQWPARLGPDGLEWSTPPSEDQQAAIEGRLVYAMQWLLRRFVDPSWINERLPPANLNEPEASTPGASET